MKKLLLGLGTLSLTALSVLTIVSCGGSTDGGTTTPDPETTTDLRITSKPSIQSTIDKAITDFNASGASDADKIAALQTVFTGITETNFKNFDVKATPTAGSTPGTITLTAKPGFSFGTSATLTQNLVLDLGIEPIRVAQTVINKAITDFNASVATEANKIAALKTTFTGITETNFKNFDVKTTPTAGSTAGTITLTAKDGFIFGASKTLSSWSLDEKFDLKIIAAPSTQPTIDKAIADFNASGATEADKIAALSTVFVGITTENFKNFDVTATAGTPGTPGTIVLTAKPDFTFNGKPTLSSYLSQVVDLKITATPSTQAVIDKAINDFKAASTDATKITALTPVFKGITTANFNNFDVQPTTTSGSTPGTIVLRAKPGFNFNGQPTLISISTSTPVADLKITAKPVIQSVITAAIKSIHDTPTLENKIRALSTVFAGITTANFNNFDGDFLGTAPNQQIRLTAKTGFNFGGNPTLTSVTVPNPVVDLGITATPSLRPIVDAAITAITKSGATDANKITALQTVFAGVTTANFQNFTWQITGTAPNQQILLTAKTGFGFGASNTLSSISREIVKLPISRRADLKQPIIDAAVALIKLHGATATTLQTCFDGVTADNMKNFDVETPPTADGIAKIVLRAKTGFVFSRGESVLTTDFVAPDNWMKISPRPNLQAKINVVSQLWYEVHAAGKPYVKEVWLVALQEIFYGVTAENIDNFIVENPRFDDYNNPIIPIRAKAPYLFSNGEEVITSQAGRPDTWMAITAKPVHPNVINDAVNVLDASPSPTQKLKALQTVFNGITAENVDKFTFTHAGDWPNTVITLTSIAPYLFNDGASTLNSQISKVE